MSTNKKIDVYKDFSFGVRSRAKGYYDFNDLYVLNENGNVNIEQTPYDGATLAYDEGVNSASCANININLLPDYSRYLGENTVCLMPEGQNYKDVALLELNPYFINDGCTIEDGIATKTSSNSMLINKKIGNYSSLIATVKCQFNSASSHMAVMSDSSSTEEDFGIRSSGKFSFYKGGWVDGVSTVQANTWYYLRIIIENNTTTYYSLLDDNYTYSTLPAIENWTLECSINLNLFMQDSLLYLGYDHNVTSESLTGKIDLNNSKVIIDNNIFWEYPQYAPIPRDLNGCLHNYTDNGSAANLDCYCLVKDDKTEQKLILTQDNSVQISGYDSMYVGTLSVPAHDTYTYSEQTQTTDYSEFTKYGDVSLNTTTGIASSFSTSKYLRLNIPLQTTLNNWDICFKVTVPDGSVTQYGRVFQSGQSNDQLSFAVGTNGICMRVFDSTNFITSTLPRGTYYVRCTGDGSTGIIYTSLDGIEWTQQASNTYTPTSVNIPFFDSGARTYDSHSGCVFSGSIDLSKSYVKINGNYLYNPIKVIGVWTKK